jgi:Radical SAM superfamily
MSVRVKRRGSMIGVSSPARSVCHVTCPDADRQPDILLLTLPPVFGLRCPPVPPDISSSTVEQHPSTGLAFLATQIRMRSNFIPAICYGHQVRTLGDDGGERLLGVAKMADVCTASGARVIGLSLMSQVELEFAGRLVRAISRSASRAGRAAPFVVVGGAQATNAPRETARALDVIESNVIPGRALVELLAFLDRTLGGSSDRASIDFTDPVLPQYLDVSSHPALRKPVTPIITFMSSGGSGCEGRPPCSFCTAYFLGQEIFVARRQFVRQIDALAAAGVRNVLAGDNAINLADVRVRDEFAWRASYALRKNVPLRHFLARPDHVAATPADFLRLLRDLLVDSVLVGVESGDAETLRAMRKCARGNEQEFLGASRLAVQKLSSAGITPVIGAILGYPIERGAPADGDTLQFLQELRRISGGKARIEIHPLYVSPGSGVYSALLRQGADHDSIARYNIRTEQAFRSLTGHYAGDLGETLAREVERWDEPTIRSILRFAGARRRALRALVPD